MTPLSGKLWPAHPKPLPDELLTSWIVRLARANGLKLQTFCDRVFGKEHQLWNRDIDRLAPSWLLTSLANHTGTPISAIRLMTLDIYRGRLYHQRSPTGQLRWILPAGIYHRTRRRFGIQFCSQCLADNQEPYFHTQWRVAVLTYCSMHRMLLHDRCPVCKAPIAFHRRELGHPSITDPGPLCLCHACNFDLRNAPVEPYTPYETSIGHTLDWIAAHTAGQGTNIDIGYLDVLHQLCKVMVSRRKSAKLAAYVTTMIGSQVRPFALDRQAFEWRPISERHHIIQLATWLLAAPKTRLPAAWEAKAVHYNDLTRDFPSSPQWYRVVIDAFNRGLRSRGQS